MALDKKIIFGLAVVVILVILFALFLVMKKKEPYIVGNEGSASNTHTLITDAKGNLSTTYSVPIGSIMLWHGSPETVPQGWGICDGSMYNGLTSPDLRNVFVLGAGGMRNNSPVNAVNWPQTSGYDNNGAIGGANYVTLTAGNIPSHLHALWTAQGPVGNPGIQGQNGNGPLAVVPSENPGTWQYTTGFDTKDGNPYVAGPDFGPIGGGTPFSIIPPYIALFYIIKYA